MASKKVTRVFPKVKNKPKTNSEKVKRLEAINPAFVELCKVFGLEY